MYIKWRPRVNNPNNRIRENITSILCCVRGGHFVVKNYCSMRDSSEVIGVDDNKTNIREKGAQKYCHVLGEGEDRGEGWWSMCDENGVRLRCVEKCTCSSTAHCTHLSFVFTYRFTTSKVISAHLRSWGDRRQSCYLGWRVKHQVTLVVRRRRGTIFNRKISSSIIFCFLTITNSTPFRYINNNEAILSSFEYWWGHFLVIS